MAALADRPRPDRLRRPLPCRVAAVGGRAGNRPGLRQVAGIAAAWFFGNNPAGVAMYDPATGRTYDGIEGDPAR